MNEFAELKHQDILIAGVIRNGEESVEKALRKILESLPEFNKIHILVVESDSSDETIKVLECLTETIPNLDYISLGNLQWNLPKRTERIAHARNVYLTEYLENPKYRNCHYLLVSDLDGVTNLLNAGSFNNCFRDDESIHTANQAAPYYDIWALRHPLWSPNDCWEEHAFFRSKYRWPERSLEKAIFSRMITLPSDSEPIEVESAFGGMALYPRKSLLKTEYRGISDDGNEVCEHVYFNARIRDNGFKILVDPQMINTGYTVHTSETKLYNKAKRISMYPFKFLVDLLKR